jgi:hypothetical protein
MITAPQLGRRLSIGQVEATGARKERVEALAAALETKADELISAHLAKDPSGPINLSFSVHARGDASTWSAVHSIEDLSADEIRLAARLFGEKYADEGQYEVRVKLGTEYRPHANQTRRSMYVDLMEPQPYRSLRFAPYWTDNTFELRFFPEQFERSARAGEPS